MELGSIRGPRVALTIVGYEFPRHISDYDDLNWLNVQFETLNQHGNWSNTSPALQTTDVQDLAEWFEALAHGQKADSEWGALEPNISFEWQPSRAEGILRVLFGAEFLPKGIPPYLRDPPGRYVDIPVTSADLLAAATSLRAELTKFPIRRLA